MLHKRLLPGLLFVFFASGALAQDITRLGGDLTSDLPIGAALELPAPNIRSSEMFDVHLRSHRDFHGSFQSLMKDGKHVLGPNFNHNACGACHFKDGRGPITLNKNALGSAILVKVGLRGQNLDGSARNVPGVGEQLQDRTLNGKTRFNLSIKYKYRPGRYPDGTRYKLREPVLSFDIPGVNERRVVHSIRMSPPTIGMGLLEAVPNSTLEAMADPNDLNGDGISGRVSYVVDRITNQGGIGRFGFKATHPTLKQQSAAAFVNDMGLTNEVFKGADGSQEIDFETMARVVFYMQAAGVSPARNQDDPDVIEGKRLFQQINCHACHTMTLRTGDSEVLEVANQEFHPFTDLLLHDMGRGLSDNRPEFTSTGREWRTTPLWGLGLVKALLKDGRTGFLHDGRARTIEEAILWHGGEAVHSRNDFKALNRLHREQLLKFLNSL